MSLENVYRLKINALHLAKEAGKVKGEDIKTVRDLHDKAIATSKAKYPMPLDLKTLATIEALHKKYCH